MRSSTNNQSHFSKVEGPQIERSSFDRSCGLKTTFDVGQLIPVFADEALPGDTLSLQMHNFARLATPIYPLMDNMFLDSFFFAVPIRLLWENWEKFNGEQTDPGDSTDYLIPISTTPGGSGAVQGSVSDYLGVPPYVPDLDHSVLWHRAYNLIWNNWFRDENLQDSLTVPTDDGPDPHSLYMIQKRGKRHDYFTSCLPFPQKGPAVTLPLGTSAPVALSGTVDVVSDGGDPTWLQGTGTPSAIYASTVDPYANWSPPIANAGVQGWGDPHLEADISSGSGVADLTGATTITVEALREAVQLQRLYERDARGGSRYTEIVRSHFGVVSPDQRLQRPEYLGGGSQDINFTPVAKNAENGNNPQGNLAAFATSQGSNHGFQKSFTEHCIVIGLVAVRADLNYQQGLPRMFSRRTRWDHYWPALAHLGEQAVLNKEIYAQGSLDAVADEAVFGYQERFAEYRYKESMTTGQMRSTASVPLDAWHLAQDFGSLPVLDSAFIQENPPIARVIAVPSEPDFLFDAYFAIRSARPIPTYGTPGQMDRF